MDCRESSMLWYEYTTGQQRSASATPHFAASAFRSTVLLLGVIHEYATLGSFSRFYALERRACVPALLPISLTARRCHGSWRALHPLARNPHAYEPSPHQPVVLTTRTSHTNTSSLRARNRFIHTTTKMAPTAAAACVPGAARRSRRRMHTPFTPPESKH